MTDEEVRTMPSALFGERHVRVWALEDGPEVGRDRMRRLCWQLQEVASALPRGLDILGLQDRVRELRSLMPEGRHDPQELAAVESKFARRPALRLWLQVRMDHVRSVQKNLRAMGRLMENVYAASSPGVWLKSR